MTLSIAIKSGSEYTFWNISYQFYNNKSLYGWVENKYLLVENKASDEEPV